MAYGDLLKEVGRPRLIFWMKHLFIVMRLEKMRRVLFDAGGA